MSSNGAPLMAELRGVSKRYRLGQGLYQTLAEDLVRFVRRRRRPAATAGGRVEGDSLWALRDVNLQIRAGETVGIVGPNGAGKSTTLKLIAGTIAPTAGTVRVRGRVAPLIEVGQGIHFELTGRENIFLNGAILGMTGPEVKRKFDAIVEFSGLEQFLDTPVKRYSSGMKARLAMGVALHVEPDLLLVDEVLAVGDMVFQNRCMDRMREFRESGVTVVYVSHDMTSVLTTCKRVVWVDGGQYRMDGPASEVVAAFQQHEGRRLLESSGDGIAADERGTRIVLEQVKVLGPDGQPCRQYLAGDMLKVEIDYRAVSPVEEPAFEVAIRGAQGFVTTVSQVVDGNIAGAVVGRGRVTARFCLPRLAPGAYQVVVACLRSFRVQYLQPVAVAHFDVPPSVKPRGLYAEAYLPTFYSESPLITDCDWHHQPWPGTGINGHAPVGAVTTERTL